MRYGTSLQQSMKNRMKKYIFLFLTVLIFHANSLCAQGTKVVTGSVVDQKGEPLIGATVKKIGSKTGTITDLSGNFKLTVDNNVSFLSVSYIGYKSTTAKISASNTVKAVLKEDLHEMDQVVVIGYGSVKKSNVTSAISKVKGEDIEDRPVSNVASALQGELAGVEVRTTTGKPGSGISINVRGATSINEDGNSNPLYVVDGVPMDDDFDLIELNTNDIASIDVLKDASSSAIYGSRGANGVVLLTTKKGNKAGRNSITFSANFSLQQVERKLNLMSASEWVAWRTKMTTIRYADTYANKGATADDDYAMRCALRGGLSQNYVTDYRWSMEGHPGVDYVDWQDAVFGIAPMQNYQISATGGNSQNNYRVSVGYVNQDGIIVNSNYKRLNASANMETTIKKNLIFGANVSSSTGWERGADVDGKDNAAMGIVTASPVVESDAGLYTGTEGYSTYAYANGGASPYPKLVESNDVTETMRANVSAYIRAKLFKGFTAEILGSWSFINREARSYNPGSATSKWNNNHEGYYSTASVNGNRRHSFMLQTLLHYDRNFGKHSLSAVAGWSMETSASSTQYKMSATQFPNDVLKGFNNNDEEITSANFTYNSPGRMISMFGRLQYNYDERYLANISLRHDGSSKFGSSKRWGTFPAISAAWHISNEKFWPENTVLNDLKLRASYGINGSTGIPANSANGTLSSENYTYNGTVENGYALASSENPDLSWQKTDSWNIALDMGMFKNRISLSVDYYVKEIRDMLYQISLPSIMGYSKAYSNIGSIRNNGLEIELKTVNTTGILKWTTYLNFAFAKDKVLDLGDNSTIYTGYGRSTQVVSVGRAVGEYYLYDAIGVFQTQAELDKYPHQATDKVGDIRYRDVNDDGEITDADRTYFGHPHPSCTYGFTNTFKWKNWDASILVTAQTGGKIFAAIGRVIDRQGQGYHNNALKSWLNMWYSESEPGDGVTPSIYGSAEQYDDRWLYSSDFIKIKNITIGYNFPMKKKYLVSSLRLTGSIENVIQFDSYGGGFSPESNNITDRSTSYYDYGAYPMARTYCLGLKLSF